MTARVRAGRTEIIAPHRERHAHGQGHWATGTGCLVRDAQQAGPHWVAGVQAAAGMHATLPIPLTHWGPARVDPLQAAPASRIPKPSGLQQDARNQSTGLLTSTGLCTLLMPVGPGEGLWHGGAQLGSLQFSSPTSFL